MMVSELVLDLHLVVQNKTATPFVGPTLRSYTKVFIDIHVNIESSV